MSSRLNTLMLLTRVGQKISSKSSKIICSDLSLPLFRIVRKRSMAYVSVLSMKQGFVPDVKPVIEQDLSISETRTGKMCVMYVLLVKRLCLWTMIISF